jgi:cell shape-determining protein MreC
VLLMTDRNVLLAVRFPESGVFGVLRGGGVLDGEGTRLDVLCAPAPARADFIHKEAWIQAGDRVVTSGLGGRYPPDILVGYVQQVTTNRAGLYLEAKVVPAADLGRLRFVSVLVPPG